MVTEVHPSAIASTKLMMVKYPPSCMDLVFILVFIAATIVGWNLMVFQFSSFK